VLLHSSTADSSERRQNHLLLFMNYPVNMNHFIADTNHISAERKVGFAFM